MSYQGAATPGSPPSTNRLVAVLVGLLLIAIVVIVALVLRDQDEPEAPDVLPTPTEEGPPVSPDPSPEPSEEPTPDAMPLLGPEESRFVDEASAIPGSADSLEDGDYFGFLHSIDPVARTVEVDIAVFYVGQAAIDWLTANEPEAENPPPNDYYIVNEVERLRTVSVSPAVRIWDWCYGEGVAGPAFVERADLGAWAAAPMEFDLECSAGAAMPRDPAGIYWFDVRGGVVQQVVGQFVP